MGRLSDQISNELETATENKETTPKVEVKEENPATTTDAKSETGKKDGQIQTSPETSGEGKKEGGEPGEAAKENKAETPKNDSKTEAKSPTAPQTFTFKVDGEEQTVTANELIRRYQKEEAADKRFREAHKRAEAAEGIKEAFEKDPFGLLEQLYSHRAGDDNRGLSNLRQAMIEYLKPWAQAQENPEDLARYEEKQKLDRERKSWEAEKARIQAEKQAALTERTQEEYTQQIIKAFKASGLENNQKNVRKVTEILKESLDYDLGVTPEEAVAQVKAEVESSKTAQVSQPPSIDELLSDPKRAEEIEKKLIERRKPPSTPPFTSTQKKDEGQKETQERAPRQKIQTRRNFHESILEMAEHG